ncbi:MAG: PIG-L family deacetylase [Acidimicrobiales bacterium]|nr:PIG-L family deacetylase [Acidimicrobiales bacterium]
MGVPEKILCIAAHPDDLDFGAAGTIAAWASKGVKVTYLIITDGDAGGNDRSISRRDMAMLRQKEQRQAAKEVGVTDVHFLGYSDGRVTCTIELRRDISRFIRQLKPDRVLAPSPERSWDRIFASHPDHMAVGEASVFAIYPDARNPFAHPELLNDELEPHTVKELWLMAAPSSFLGPQGSKESYKEASFDCLEPSPLLGQPGTWVCAVDITETFQNKINALKSHASQTNGMEDLEGLIRAWTEITASTYGLADGHLAECFQVVYTG